MCVPSVFVCVCVCVCVQYMSNVDSWCKACGEVELPSELQDLEDAIHHHQGLYEHITAAYSEVTCLSVCVCVCLSVCVCVCVCAT